MSMKATITDHAKGATVNTAKSFDVTAISTCSEIVYRNDESFNYITKRKLNTKKGLSNALKTNGVFAANFPKGSIEIKTQWTEDVIGSSSIKSYVGTKNQCEKSAKLAGMHIMIKVRKLKDADNPFQDSKPTWFWATFEFDYKSGSDQYLIWDNGQVFVTQRDSIPKGNKNNLLSLVHLDKTNLINYRLNGTQASFLSDQGEPIILGNTTMEDFAFCPKGETQDRVVQLPLTGWRSSCHTCHAMVGAKIEKGTGKILRTQFGSKTGRLPGGYPNNNDTSIKSLDFVWAFMRMADGKIPMVSPITPCTESAK